MTDPEKRCSTCGTPKCNDCASFWSQREDVAAQVVKPPMAPEDSQLRDCGTCEASRTQATEICTHCRMENLSNWSPRKPSPADYYDGEACMDACRLACRGRSGIEGHLVASAIQYLWRSGRKGAALPDLLKARDMVDRLVRENGGGK